MKTTLQKLNEIRKRKTIYNILFRNAGGGFLFYYPEKDLQDTPLSYERALSIDEYYGTFEEAVNAEYKRLK